MAEHEGKYSAEDLRQELLNSQDRARVLTLDREMCERMIALREKYRGALQEQLPEDVMEIVWLSGKFHSLISSTVSKENLERELHPDVKNLLSQIDREIDDIADGILRKHPADE